MGVVGSIPSPLEDIPTSIDQKCNDDPMSVSYHVISDDQLKTNIKTEIIDDKPIEDSCPVPANYTNVSYGPITVRVWCRDRPTLKTGRRSKFLVLEGDEALKRERRRERNRRNAQKFKEKQIHIETQLINQVKELEHREKDLTSKIEDLQSYKEFLNQKYEQKISFEKEGQIKIESC
jgi:hypothetical protein